MGILQYVYGKDEYKSRVAGFFFFSIMDHFGTMEMLHSIKEIYGKTCTNCVLQ